MRILNKKAESGTGMSLETLGKLILVVIVLIALWMFTAKLLHMFSSDKEDATKRNFETIFTTLKTMEKGATFTNYPVYVESDFVILGYWTNSNAIGGICPLIGVTEQMYNVKPEECGLGNTGCLCLCDQNDDFEKVCQNAKEVKLCKNADDFGKDLSFEGDRKTCDFALIQGKDKPQTINITENNNIVVISS